MFLPQKHTNYVWVFQYTHVHTAAQLTLPTFYITTTNTSQYTKSNYQSLIEISKLTPWGRAITQRC